MEKVSIFWFRRDLRLNDNIGLNEALKTGKKIITIFIFDQEILSDLEKDDARVSFIHAKLKDLNSELMKFGSSLLVLNNSVIEAWKSIVSNYKIECVFFNHDYEPYALKRDEAISQFLKKNNIPVYSFKDHVFFEKNEIVKADGTPYTVYTAYKNKWLETFNQLPKYEITDHQALLKINLLNVQFNFPDLEEIGFQQSRIIAPEFDLKKVTQYEQFRDIPSKNHTTHIGHHLRFGTVSIRSLVYYASKKNQTFLSELIWRDFFSQILYHFPNVITQSFKPQYDFIQWQNDEVLFEKWCNGKTGYPIVDAGMRELNATGFMHNRVRMIAASFLVKHLLIDWRWGEAYFAEKLLDFDLASNNGNWQWAAGCGCDAAPYFRVFSPRIQQEKFDPNQVYVKKWVPEFNTKDYCQPIIEHTFARERAIKTYKEGIALAVT